MYSAYGSNALPHGIRWNYHMVLLLGLVCCFRNYGVNYNNNINVTAWSMMQMGIGQPKGSASTPYNKQKILLIGSGGYLGGITFGYLQRAASLYGTGIGPIRCISATADTSIRLNRILNKHFNLAQADESYIKLTNLMSINAIYDRMIGYDAILFSPNLYVEQKTVTANTYEISPNDKAWEIYWDLPKGSYSDFQQSAEAIEMKEIIIQNFISAAQQAKLKHIFLVIANHNDSDSVSSKALAQVKSLGIPFTCIQTPQLTDRSSAGYTFQDGLYNDLIVTSVDESMMGISDRDTDKSICREDVAALCVQAIQSCDWNQPQRYLKVSTNGPLLPLVPSSSASGTVKRIDQQWCINSFILEAKLNDV